MSYDTQDTSVEDGAPITLYEFYVDGQQFYYTSFQSEHSIMLDGVSRPFQPRQVSRSAITYSYNLNDASKVDVTLPINDPVSYLLNGLITPQDIVVAIYEVHATDVTNEAKRLFMGYVTDVETNTDAKTTRVSVASLMQSHLNTTISDVIYSRSCNHAFGDSRCGFDIEAAGQNAVVSAVDVWKVTISGTGYDSFAGGKVKNLRTGLTQPLIDVDGNVLYTLGGFADIVVGDQMRLYPGCDHLIDGDCANEYDNTINFGGFPRVPRKNPFVKGFGEDNYQDEVPH